MFQYIIRSGKINPLQKPAHACWSLCNVGYETLVYLPKIATHILDMTAERVVGTLSGGLNNNVNTPGLFSSFTWSFSDKSSAGLFSSILSPKKILS